jgi:hypothetical protein
MAQRTQRLVVVAAHHRAAAQSLGQQGIGGNRDLMRRMAWCLPVAQRRSAHPVPALPVSAGMGTGRRGVLAAITVERPAEGHVDQLRADRCRGWECRGRVRRESALGAASLPSLLTLGALCSGVAFHRYYVLVSEVGAARASLNTYLSPALAVAFGVIVLDSHSPAPSQPACS